MKTKAEKKLLIVAEEILDASVIALKDEPIYLYFNGDSFFGKNFTILEMYQILLKLQELELIKILQGTIYEEDSKIKNCDYFLVKISDNLEQWIVLQKLMQDGQSNLNGLVKHWIEFDELNAKISLDGKYLLRKLNFDKENHIVFSFLYKNPNKTFTLGDLENKIDIKLSKDFHKIIENLGFDNEIRKMFFVASKDAIHFINPVGLSRLKTLGLENFVVSDHYKV